MSSTTYEHRIACRPRRCCPLWLRHLRLSSSDSILLTVSQQHWPDVGIWMGLSEYSKLGADRSNRIPGKHNRTHKCPVSVCVRTPTCLLASIRFHVLLLLPYYPTTLREEVGFDVITVRPERKLFLCATCRHVIGRYPSKMMTWGNRGFPAGIGPSWSLNVRCCIGSRFPSLGCNLSATYHTQPLWKRENVYVSTHLGFMTFMCILHVES